VGEDFMVLAGAQLLLQVEIWELERPLC
jgi:hypothetical protein